ncbi:protein D2-like [Diadema antillarum]|uniref:protein D2-like n=1 Tax=Diadema antillarum TaxID=105358 RepID=UPI003A852977
MSAKFAEHAVVPDVIDQAPAAVAEVSWSSGVKCELGNVLTPTAVKDVPTVTWPAEDGAFYTVIMTDPDAPSRQNPKAREWRHWLVVNVRGNDISKGLLVAPYVGSGPPKDTGLHRYCFLVYKQPGEIQYQDPILKRDFNGRASTKARDVAAKYNLGDPVAGNFFQAEWDDYVPQLMKELSS